MNSKNSKTSDPYRLLLNLTYKIDLRRKDKYTALSNLSNCYTWENIKRSYKNNKFKISTPTWNKKFELQWFIFYTRYSKLFWIYIKKQVEKAVNLSIRIYINKMENRVTFKIKTGYYLELLTPVTIKLLGSTKNKITKNENGENVPYLEVTEAVLLHRNVANNSYRQNSGSLVYICS